MEPGATALAVENLFKSFRLPTRRVDTLRERLLAGLTPATTELQVLRNVSFRVGAASSSGSRDVTAPERAPCSSWCPAFTARTPARSGRPVACPDHRARGRLHRRARGFRKRRHDAVMMGLEPSEARARYPEILDFAELRDFEHLKLKNYSSECVPASALRRCCTSTPTCFCSTRSWRWATRASGEVRQDVLPTQGIRPNRGPGDALDGSHAAQLRPGAAARRRSVLAAGSPKEVAREYESLRGRPLTAHPASGNRAPA